MGRVFTVEVGAFTPGSAKTILELMAAAEVGFKVRRLELTSDDTAGSTVVDGQLLRITATGTSSTTATLRPHDQNDTPTVTAKANASGEPTSGVTLLPFKWNIQVPYILVFGPGEEYAIPSATNEGFAIELLDNPSSEITVSCVIEET